VLVSCAETDKILKRPTAGLRAQGRRCHKTRRCRLQMNLCIYRTESDLRGQAPPGFTLRRLDVSASSSRDRQMLGGSSRATSTPW